MIWLVLFDVFDLILQFGMSFRKTDLLAMVLFWIWSTKIVLILLIKFIGKSKPSTKEAFYIWWLLGSWNRGDVFGLLALSLKLKTGLISDLGKISNQMGSGNNFEFYIIN